MMKMNQRERKKKKGHLAISVKGGAVTHAVKRESDAGAEGEKE